MNYKLSEFNLKISYDYSSYLLFNTYTTSLLRLYKADFDEISDNITNTEFIENNIKLINHLTKLGFVLDSDFDEKANIKIRNRQWKHNPKTYSIAIVPNIDCNFRCTYCFEDIQPKYMSEDTIQNIEKYFSDRIKENQIESLGIGWYGGEPLLSMKVIERLSKTFIKIPNYKAYLYTNGYGFNDDFIRNLSVNKITLIHITLDGIKETHDKYRIHRNKIPTFDKIVENIHKIIEYNNDSISINIRTNLDNNNKDGYGKLLKLFKSIKSNKISFQFHKIEEKKTGIGANYCKEMSNDEFEDVYKYAMKELIGNGYRKPTDFLPRSQNFHHCYVGLDNGFTIGHDGAIYKCFGDSNPPNNSIGKLNHEGNIDFITSEYFHWYNYEYINNENCKNCILLPVCMGGCTHQRLGLTPNVPEICDRKSSIKYATNIIKDVYNLKAK
ncbi:MAG: SPASM domain-containing protein [Bacteroidales bacterium]|jgi:uncharacterized protein|nr:SPASM domain-containing protein [Bacteroidales bacterium]